MNKYLLSGVVLLLSACATSYEFSYSYNEIVVANNSSRNLQEVSFTIPETGRSYDCGTIGPNRVCAKKFGTRRYQNQPIRVEWTSGGGSRESKEIMLPAPPSDMAGDPIKGVLKYGSQGVWTADSFQKIRFR